MATPFSTVRVNITDFTIEQVQTLQDMASIIYGCNWSTEDVPNIYPSPDIYAPSHFTYAVISGEWAHMFEGYDPDTVDDDGGNSSIADHEPTVDGEGLIC